MAVHKTQEELKKEFRIEETTEGIVITGWLNEDVNCLIPDDLNIVGIKRFAFFNCDKMTSITIPNSVTNIDEDAIYGCSGLTRFLVSENNEIYSSSDGVLFNKEKTELICCPGGKQREYIVPNGVTHIGKGAFSNCGKLTNVVISDSVISIGESAFSGCSYLTKLTIPNSVTAIGDGAFDGCKGLMDFQVSENNAFYASVDGVLFNKEKTELIRYPGGKQGEYIVPGGVTHIGAWSFFGCGKMTGIAIPDSVTGIGESTFQGCTGITTLMIPDSVTSIGERAFSGCNSLTDFQMSENNLSYASIDGVLFNKQKTELLYYPGGKQGEYIVPDGVTHIGAWSFCGCDKIIGVHIRNDVQIIGDSAFFECSNLTNVYIGDGVTSIGEWAFSECGNLTGIYIGDSVVSIGEYAFNDCSSLAGLIIPDSVTSIGKRVFSGCSSLTSLHIGNGVTSIRDWEFTDFSSLTNVYIGNSVTSIGKFAFSGCGNLTSIHLGDSVVSIGEYAFNDCSSLAGLIIPDSVTSIGKRVFSGCSSLTSLHIGNGVTSIRDWEFTDFSSLTNVYIGNSVTSIGKFAFSGCGNLTSIHLGDSVVDIGMHAFDGCKNLTNITLSKNAVLNERKLPYGVTVTRVSESPETKEAKIKTHSQATVSKTKVKGKNGEYKKLNETVKISADGTKFLINDQWSFKIPDDVSYDINATHDTHMSAFSLDSKIKTMVLTFDDCDFSLALNPHFDLRHTYYTADEVRNDNREETGEDGCTQRKVITDDGDLIVDMVVCSLFIFGAEIDIRVRADGIEPFNFSGVIEKSDLDSDGWENTWETIKQRLRYMAESICKEIPTTENEHSEANKKLQKLAQAVVDSTDLPARYKKYLYNMVTNIYGYGTFLAFAGWAEGVEEQFRDWEYTIFSEALTSSEIIEAMGLDTETIAVLFRMEALQERIFDIYNDQVSDEQNHPDVAAYFKKIVNASSKYSRLMRKAVRYLADQIGVEI